MASRSRLLSLEPAGSVPLAAPVLAERSGVPSKKLGSEQPLERLLLQVRCPRKRAPELLAQQRELGPGELACADLHHAWSWAVAVEPLGGHLVFEHD
jgi:hypothetical protein